MSKQRKHTKKSTMRKKKRRMAEHAREHAVKEANHEKRWNVVIARRTNGGPVTAWHKYEYGYFGTDDMATEEDLASDGYRFTDGEFEELCKALMAMPYGPAYVKIAELGKREVKE